MCKTPYDYIAAFNCFDKSLFVLPGTSGSVFIASFATVIGATIGVTSANLSFCIFCS